MDAVELVSTGNELLSGRTVNRHANALGDALRPIGLRLVRDTTVGDDITLIADAVSSALDRVEILFVSGGLGPTSDDVTRDGIARALNRGVVSDPRAMEALRERYAQFGREVTPASERQALVVEGAEALLNPVGIAPGEEIACAGGKTIYVLPGPPHEFDAIVRTHIVPRLRDRFHDHRPAGERYLMLCGIGESEAAARIEAAALLSKGFEIGYCASPGRLEIRVSAPAESIEKLDDVHRRLSALLGRHVYAEAVVSMEDTVLRMLADRGLTLATVEVGSAGVLARSLAGTPAGIGWYVGGLVANANDVLVRDLGVDPALIELHGAVSRPVAAHMAAAVRDRFRADIGLCITDIADDRGEEGDGPGGRVFIGIDDGRETELKSLRMPAAGDWIPEWLKQMALDRVRRRLLRGDDGGDAETS